MTWKMEGEHTRRYRCDRCDEEKTSEHLPSDWAMLRFHRKFDPEHKIDLCGSCAAMFDGFITEALRLKHKPLYSKPSDFNINRPLVFTTPSPEELNVRSRIGSKSVKEDLKQSGGYESPESKDEFAADVLTEMSKMVQRTADDYGLKQMALQMAIDTVARQETKFSTLKVIEVAAQYETYLKPPLPEPTNS